MIMLRVIICTIMSAAAAAAVLVVGSGMAQAKSSPDVVGKKYSDATSALSDAGFTPVVSTTVGDRLSQADCVVTHQQDRTEAAVANSSGSTVSQTLISLNCDAAVASNKKPGNSVGSPEGREAIESAKASASATLSAAEPSG